MLKKITALCLALLLFSLCAVSCADDNEGIPDGMKSATLAGEPFLLYVPESWSLNTAGGISGAFYNSAQKILISARYYTPADPAMTLDGYVDFCSASYAETLSGYTVTARDAAILGGANAVRLNYTVTDGENSMTCFQITASYGGDFVSLHGYCASSLYEARQADYDSIIREFTLCEKSDPNGEPLTDKDTPAGFEIASAKHLEYRLYVPEVWVCDAQSGASEAYYPESGRSNIAVTSYSPTVSIGLEEYFAQCEESYKVSLPEYERLGSETRTVSGRVAHSYTYRTRVDGLEYTIMQTLCVQNQNIYSITYTALSENFELHREDVEAILNAFTFR